VHPTNRQPIAYSRSMSSKSTPHSARQLADVGVWDELQDLENRLRTVERKFESMGDKQKAHMLAKEQDAREQIERGQTETLVVEESPREGECDRAVCYLDGIVTFVEPDGVDLERTDIVQVRISDVQKNALQAILLERMEEL